jgi:archaellum component FlaC
MANGVTAAASAARETRREPFPALAAFVDEKRFESEVRRIDAAASDEKRNREKFETRIEKIVIDLRGEMHTQFEKVDAQFGKVDARFDKIDARFEKVDARFDKVDARFEKVESEIKDLRGELNARMDRLDERLWWIFGAIALSILVPVTLRYM